MVEIVEVGVQIAGERLSVVALNQEASRQIWRIDQKFPIWPKSGSAIEDFG